MATWNSISYSWTLQNCTSMTTPTTFKNALISSLYVPNRFSVCVKLVLLPVYTPYKYLRKTMLANVSA